MPPRDLGQTHPRFSLDRGAPATYPCAPVPGKTGLPPSHSRVIVGSMRRSLHFVLAGGVLVAASLVAACEKSKGPEGEMPAPASDVVARLGKNVITVDDVQEQLNRREAFVRARYTAPEKKKEFLDGLVRFELLAQEALKKGYQNDPDLIRMYKQWLVARLVQKNFDPQFEGKAIPQEEVRSYYEAHKQEMLRPERRRAGEIVVKTEAVANKVVALARKLGPADSAGFTELVTGFTEDPVGQRRNGETGPLVASGANTRTPKEVIDVIFSMGKPGDVGGPISVNNAFYVVRLMAIEPSAIPPFEEMEGQIRERLNKARRDKGMVEWVGKLKGDTKVELFPEVLNQVKVDTTSPPKPFDKAPVFQIAPELVPGNQ